MTTRAKLTLISLEPSTDGSSAFAKFECQYDSANTPEDNTFSKFTPFGNANFSITNPNVLQNLEVGKKYYFDIIPCD